MSDPDPVDERATPLQLGSRVVVRLLKHAKRDLVYGMTVTFDDGDHIVVEGPFAEPRRIDLGYTTFELGDHFVEHYWRNRWYSVKEIHDPTRGQKGWYCDVARPVRVIGDSITSVDLDLDLWVSADGAEVLVLDEDEFIASGLLQTDPASAANARAALDELRLRAIDRFATISEPGGTIVPGELTAPE